MNTKDCGDVVLIPNSVSADQLPDFFEPLGTVDTMGKTYRFIREQAFDGKVYGLAQAGNANGFVYNRRVWEAAGITSIPTTPDEFVADLRLISDETDAVPLYTNYAAGWPMTQWEGNRGSITNNPEYVNDMAHVDAPWTAGTDHFVIDRLIWDIASSGLIEADPTTTDWETSKRLIGRGEIATMSLGSWAIVQLEAAASNPDDIGYMPFPHQIGGTHYSTIGGDYKVAINKNSSNRAAARAWLDWFINNSNYAFDQGGIPARLDGQFPPQLSDFQKLGVNFVELSPERKGEEGLTKNVDSEAEIGLFDPRYRQRIVDAARGKTGETIEQIFADLNARWTAARATLGVR